MDNKQSLATKLTWQTVNNYCKLIVSKLTGKGSDWNKFCIILFVVPVLKLISFKAFWPGIENPTNRVTLHGEKNENDSAAALFSADPDHRDNPRSGSTLLWSTEWRLERTDQIDHHQGLETD